MTPGARLQAAIDILSAMAASPGASDQTLRNYLRGRRYIGSKDRRDITERVWRVVRHRAQLGWRLHSDAPDPRTAVLTDSLLNDGRDLAALVQLCSGESYDAAPLSDAERDALTQAVARDAGEMPAHIQAECPEWLWP